MATTYNHQTNRLNNPEQPISASGSSGKLQPGTKVQVGQYVVQVEKFLSEGGFAHVYVASLVSPSSVEGFPVTQNRFVLKRMAVPDKPGLVEVRKEVDVMKQLRPHKHIVYFIEASASSIPASTGYEIFILMEWCPGGGIIDLLNSRLQNRLTESEILKIFSDTVSAVAHMHSQNPILIHRDLKVENILVASPNLYKLCDFGSTTSPLPSPPQSSAEILALEADLNKHTTLQYRAPEMVDVWSRKGVTEKADIWALGVFLYKLCYYTTPFEAHGPLAIVNVQYQIPSYPAYSNSIKYLIGTMLQELAQSRPDIWEVHEHLCRLRGVTPYLRRPTRKQSTSNVSQLPQVSKPVLPKPANNKPSGDGLDSIFTTAPRSAAVSNKEADSVVPMRRGRPTVKSKPVSDLAVPNGDSLLQSVQQQPPPTTSKSLPDNKNSPPEESDLFAREAAAGFGDAFLSPSPRINSFKPVVGPKPIVNTSFGTVLASSRSHLSLKPSVPTPNLRQDSKNASSSSSAFEDLVPLSKKSTPKTLNEMRNGLGTVTSTSTGPSFGTAKVSADTSFTTGKSGLLQHQPSQSSMSIGTGSLSQKTGPQSFPSRIQQTSNYRKISITQKTGPAISSKPSMSDWLKKDQPRLVSRSTQTSPSLLSRWINELTLAPPLNVLNVAHSSTHQPVDDHRLTQQNGGNTQISGLDSRTRAEDIQARSKPLLSASPTQEGSSSSGSSDEQPEEPAGRTAYRGPGTSLVAKPTFKPNLQASSWEAPAGVHKNAVVESSVSGNPSIKSTAEDPVIEEGGKDWTPSASSTGELSSSEAMTEEDDEVRQRRRAAIAKFAPAASSPIESKPEPLARDPFSSRAESRASMEQPTPADRPAPRRLVGPPLRAPKPQSLKSAAAINNLVSRYENLSSSVSESAQSSSSHSSPNVSLTSKRLSIFKPTPTSSITSVVEKTDHNVHQTLPAGSSSKPSHIPFKALGPGLNRTLSSNTSMTTPASVDALEDQIGDPDEQTFTSVNDLKSRWESGAVKASLSKPRPPRADYGQT
ncbi:hypothetical protein PGT21_028742 [Puccinia graminis f. sp. tritici]|uniref:non-specific serine/threonine protein kinase n=1 Tax=Puccinia graminis f. sp. tritici TaxID=56615 RepID=A0A5B0PEN1_PUCGR|nr:hypothetical protein PGT21_028742 [Puccinia graminis f. sp. tritici]